MTARPKKTESGSQAMKTVSARVPVKVAERIEQVAKNMEIPQSEVLRIALGLGEAILEAGSASIAQGYRPGFEGLLPEEYYRQYREIGAYDYEGGDFLVCSIRKDDKDWPEAVSTELELKLSISGAVPVLHELVVTQAITRLNLVPGPGGGWETKQKGSQDLEKDLEDLKQKLAMVKKFEELRALGVGDLYHPYYVDKSGRRIEDSVSQPSDSEQALATGESGAGRGAVEGEVEEPAGT